MGTSSKIKHKDHTDTRMYLPQQERQLGLQQRMGQALRHAGVAITVTSMTDCAAFLIGSTTVGFHLPPLPQSNSCDMLVSNLNHHLEGNALNFTHPLLHRHHRYYQHSGHSASMQLSEC